MKSVKHFLYFYFYRPQTRFEDVEIAHETVGPNGVALTGGVAPKGVLPPVSQPKPLGGPDQERVSEVYL